MTERSFTAVSPETAMYVINQIQMELNRTEAMLKKQRAELEYWEKQKLHSTILEQYGFGIGYVVDLVVVENGEIVGTYAGVIQDLEESIYSNYIRIFARWWGGKPLADPGLEEYADIIWVVPYMLGGKQDFIHAKKRGEE